jgi:2-oxoglutarate dehydrogenase E2 component (dihydrolipoamide succinyltransferase)
MSVEVALPELGESVVEGTISRWLVKEGDRVERDQPLVEVTTDKVDAEIPSPEAGVVEALLVAEGDVVEVGAPLLRIASGAGAEAAEVGDGHAAQREARPQQSRTQARERAGSGASERPAPTPLAKRAAEAGGVELRSIEGSGGRGRVTRADVEGAAERPARERPAAPRAVPERPADAPAARTAAPTRESVATRHAYLHYQLQPGDEVIPMTPLRRLVAEHMVLSKRVSPHVGTVAEIDMSGVARVRDVHKRAFKEQSGFALSFLPFIVHAAVRALREFPRLNASVLEDAIVEKKDIHIGIAVETEKGLVVPVVRHADRLSLAGIAQAIEDLASRARTKKLSADELKGGTFTISNPGRNGNLYGFAIINQPQVGILRMGEIVKRPVVREIEGEDAIAIRPIMHLALSYDHRAVDGAPANGFLYRIRELLEEAEFDL